MKNFSNFENIFPNCLNIFPIIVLFQNVFAFNLLKNVSNIIAITIYIEKYAVTTKETSKDISEGVVPPKVISIIIVKIATPIPNMISNGILSKSVVEIPSTPFLCPIDILKYNKIKIVIIVDIGTNT